MASTEHLGILKQGVEIWNAWREQNPDIQPDLHLMNLHGANLQEANLRGADLRWAILSITKLQGANLEDANLKDANLQEANLQGAELQGANLERANLGEADLWGAKLQKADLQKANLQRANLQKADLQGADLREVRLDHTRFSSRSVLNALAYPLTDEQMLGCLFADEEERRKEGKTTGPRRDPGLPPLPVVRARFTRGDWTPETLALYLLRLQLSFDRLTYLATTDEQDQDTLWRMVSGRCLRDDAHSIRLVRMEMGSVDISATFAALKVFTAKELRALCLAAMLGTTVWGGADCFKTIEEGLFIRAQRHEIEQRIETTAVAPLSDLGEFVPRDLVSCHERLRGAVHLPDGVEVPNQAVMARKEALFGMAAHPMQRVIQLERERDEDVTVTLEGAEAWQKRFGEDDADDDGPTPCM